MFGFFRKKQKKSEPSQSPVGKESEVTKTLLDYLRGLSNGETRDIELESKELTNDLNVDTLYLAIILRGLAKDKTLDFEALVRDSDVQIPGADAEDDQGGWSSFANLCARLDQLAETFSLLEAETMLRAGLIGPGDEVRPLDDALTVTFLVEYCKELGLVELHD